MGKIPKKVNDRILREIPAFQRILRGACDRDVNESDTVTIVADMLGSVFGFDKYTDITSEQAIRGTFCDLAVKLEGTVRYLIEVKAIGLTLRENHLRQVVNYGANQGIPWVVLTNGVVWELYRIRFEQPINHELVCSFNLLEISMRRLADREHLYLLCKEGLAKAAIEAFHERVQIVNRFVVGAILQSEAALTFVRRELRRLAPGTRVTLDEVRGLMGEVLKRDVIESVATSQACGRLDRARKRGRRTRQQDEFEPAPSANQLASTA